MKRKTKKSLALVVSLVLIITTVVGGTLAFIMDKTPEIKNTFEPSKITTSVEEDLEGSIKKNVMIKNTGDTEGFIRVAVVITWQDKDGNVFAQKPKENTDYTVSFNETDWFIGSDGFWYYKKPVKEGGLTSALIHSIEPTTAGFAKGEDDEFKFTVEIIASGIQSKPDHVVNRVWKAVEVGKDENGSRILVKAD